MQWFEFIIFTEQHCIKFQTKMRNHEFCSCNNLNLHILQLSYHRHLHNHVTYQIKWYWWHVLILTQCFPRSVLLQIAVTFSDFIACSIRIYPQSILSSEKANWALLYTALRKGCNAAWRHRLCVVLQQGNVFHNAAERTSDENVTAESDWVGVLLVIVALPMPLICLNFWIR